MTRSGQELIWELWNSFPCWSCTTSLPASCCLCLLLFILHVFKQLFRWLHICIAVCSGREDYQTSGFGFFLPFGLGFFPPFLYSLICRCQVFSYRDPVKEILIILLPLMSVDSHPCLPALSLPAAPSCTGWRIWSVAASHTDPPFTKSQ